MSSLPVVSGQQCIKALEKLDLHYFDKKGVILFLEETVLIVKLQFQIIKFWIGELYDQFLDQPKYL